MNNSLDFDGDIDENGDVTGYICSAEELAEKIGKHLVNNNSNILGYRVTTTPKNNNTTPVSLLLDLKDIHNIQPNINIENNIYPIYTDIVNKSGPDVAIKECIEKLEEVTEQIIDGTRERADAINNIHFKDEDIICQVINYESNKDMLKNMPYKQINDDLVIIYRGIFNLRKDGLESVPLTYDIINETTDFDTKDEYFKEDLYDIAVDNTKRIFETSIRIITNPGYAMQHINIMNVLDTIDPSKVTNFDGIEMEQLVAEAFIRCTLQEQNMEKPEDIPDDVRDNTDMIIISNKLMVYGATAPIIDNDIFEGLLDRYNCDNLLIAPSSIHELIIIPENSLPDNNISIAIKDESIKDIVQVINDECVETKDRLSNQYYCYSRIRGFEPITSYMPGVTDNDYKQTKTE